MIKTITNSLSIILFNKQQLTAFTNNLAFSQRNSVSGQIFQVDDGLTGVSPGDDLVVIFSVQSLGKDQHSFLVGKNFDKGVVSRSL